MVEINFSASSRDKNVVEKMVRANQHDRSEGVLQKMHGGLLHVANECGDWMAKVVGT